MKIQSTPLEGCHLITFDRTHDERGFLETLYDETLFKKHDLKTDFRRTLHSLNQKKATLRGLHYQTPPHQETKLVSASQGTIFDVALDLRPQSKTYGQWFGAELSDQNAQALYIPEGFAHGFISLTENSLVHYLVSKDYDAPSAKGVRWDDPAFKIKWPLKPKVISQRDKSYPDFQK